MFIFGNRRDPLGVLMALLCCLALGSPAALAQQAGPPSDQPQPDPSPPEAQPLAAPPLDVETPLDAETLTKIDHWIEQLSSPEFAQRERAAIGLMDLGLDVLPSLRELARQTSDAEVRLRANEIVRQLTRGDLQTRIDDFLAGKNVNFQGWPVFQAILGDTGTVRELFVQVLQSHPELTQSMEGTTRDRAIALEKAVAQVQQRIFVERKFPTRADTFALLLPVVDPNVPVTAGYESLLLSVLQKEEASKIRADLQLSTPFKALLGRWIIRSTLTSRIDALLTGMAWDVDETLPLAIQTLTDANQTETIATALQAIARFGIRDHGQLLRPLLEDTRPSAEAGYANGKLLRTELRDVAMVTIAILHGADLASIGQGHVQSHPTYGFIVNDVGFPVDDDQPRKKARAVIDQLLDGRREAEGS